jgi:hypothetical protein
MAVSSDCSVLSSRGLCNGPITRPEESYRLWCVTVCYPRRNLKNEAVPTLVGFLRQNRKVFKFKAVLRWCDTTVKAISLHFLHLSASVYKNQFQGISLTLCRNARNQKCLRIYPHLWCILRLLLYRRLCNVAQISISCPATNKNKPHFRKFMSSYYRKWTEKTNNYATLHVSFCGTTAQIGPWPPHCWGFYITHN